MPNTFQLSKNEATTIFARPEERKEVTVTSDDAYIRFDDAVEPFSGTKQIESPLTIIGPARVQVVGLDTEPSAPAQKANHDDVQEPSAAPKRVTKENPNAKKGKKK